MYIRKIHITNIRGLEEVDLDLDRGDGQLAGWTVIAGRNGSGKSTLLKALALAVAGTRRAFSLQPSFAGWIRRGKDQGGIRLVLQKHASDGFNNDREDFDVDLGWMDGGDLASSNVGEAPHDDSFPEPIMSHSLSPIATGQDSHGEVWSENPRGWFVVGYGAHRRLSSRGGGRGPQPRAVSRLEGLFDEDATFAEATRWLKDIHALSLDYGSQAERAERQHQPRDAEARREISVRLNKVLEDLLCLLNGGSPSERLLPAGHEVTEINQDGVWVKSCGVRLPLQALGDGYKTVIGLIVDITRHLYECYGHFLLEKEGGSVRVALPGVILIDEVEAHLHVEWQQRVGFWLKQHFPNVQFLVTTHSPFICQAADKKGIIRLPAPGSGMAAEHVSDEDFLTIVNGGVDEATMSALFGLEHAHSEASEKLRTQVAELEVRVIRGIASAEEKASLERLSAELPSTGSALVEQAVRKLEALG